MDDRTCESSTGVVVETGVFEVFLFGWRSWTRIEPNRTEPNRTEPNGTEPNRAEPSRTEPNRTEPNQTTGR